MLVVEFFVLSVVCEREFLNMKRRVGRTKFRFNKRDFFAAGNKNEKQTKPTHSNNNNNNIK